MLCPCHSLKQYIQCCGLFLEQSLLPQTPEALMRARYTAFCMNDLSFINQTMAGPALAAFYQHHTKQSTYAVSWVSLAIIDAPPPTSTQGFVTFVAHYLHGKQLGTLHERSEFHYIQNQWFYVDGVITPTPKRTIARTHLCPCASGKKFKNCHGI